ncbi:MAG: hypothetical protein ACREBW_03190 [Candidatus Micrarchaeaceae archaeon]
MNWTALIAAIAGLVTAIGSLIYALKGHSSNATRITTLEKGVANGAANVGPSPNVDSNPNRSLFPNKRS